MFNDKDQSYRYKDNPTPDLSLLTRTVAEVLANSCSSKEETVPLQNYDVYSSRRLINNWQSTLENEIRAATSSDYYRAMLHDIFMYVYSCPNLPQIEYSYMRSAKDYLVKFFKNKEIHSNKDSDQLEELIRQVFPKLFT
jgi:hypothetical protein